MTPPDGRPNGVDDDNFATDHTGQCNCRGRTIVSWFEREGRDLPWRRTRDPYATLVAEVMLQQTQVERVVTRYLAWLERWPTATALAAASPADVIREWQGLGYNRRAVNLHRAAQVISRDGWPADLTPLPGVGAYTAAAIRNFALGEPVLPVDVNVARVLERTGHEFAPSAGQALMDLGATVCLARVPRCGVCPLVEECPSQGQRFEPTRKQGPFEGSFRQQRSETLRRVAEKPRPSGELDPRVIQSLLRDGLVESDGELVRLPAGSAAS
ncbi:MAG: A/G-specific adenine glycosylase [Actinobacteria bacterium]|nr:MAG: A/G-specific adenine glycosylase [Actinomycetota bacterium]